MTLFRRCHSCGLEVKLKISIVGTSLVVNGIFPDGHVLHWQSQSMVRHMAAGNLLLPAAILLCGLTFTGIANLADLLNLAMLSERRFYDLQRDYVYPVVYTTYVRQQEAVVEYLWGNQLHLSLVMVIVTVLGTVPNMPHTHLWTLGTVPNMPHTHLWTLPLT